MSGLAARSGAIIASYVAASVTAAVFYTLLIVISVQVIGVEQPSELPIGQQIGMLVWFAVLVALFVMTLALVPAIVAIVVLTALGLKDIFSHALAGALVAAVAVMLAARHVLFLDRMTFDWAMALTGAAGGAAFWAVRRRLVRHDAPTA